MSLRAGSLYRVGPRLYADSQALHNLAHRHEVLPTAAGYRVLADTPIACARVDRRPALPRQQGNLYELSAATTAHLVTACTAWLGCGAIKSGGSFDTWPGRQPTATACSTCGPSCGCAPCRLRHHHSPSDEDAAQSVVDILAGRLPGYAPESETTQPHGIRVKLIRIKDGAVVATVTSHDRGRALVDVEIHSDMNAAEVLRVLGDAIERAYEEPTP